MNNKESQFTVLYSYLADKLTKGGIPRQELESLRHHPIGHTSVESFVALNLRVGNFQWRGDKLVNADRRFILGLTRQEEDKLRIRAQKAGVSETEFINQIVVGVLAND